MKRREPASGSGVKPEATDDDLAAAALHGEPWAVSDIYRRYADRLWREVIWPILRDEARAEDALCESFMSAMQALPTFQFQPGGTATLYPWLKQIARRKALDQLRQNQRAGKLAEHVSAEASRAPPEPTSHDLMEERERDALKAERVGEVLAELNPRYAQVLRLRLQEGQSRESCAAMLNVKVGNFDVMLHRAMKSFRDRYLERYHLLPEDEV